MFQVQPAGHDTVRVNLDLGIITTPAINISTRSYEIARRALGALTVVFAIRAAAQAAVLGAAVGVMGVFSNKWTPEQAMKIFNNIYQAPAAPQLMLAFLAITATPLVVAPVAALLGASMMAGVPQQAN